MIINTLYILRGLPGSGKSTFAKKLFDYHYKWNSSVIISADAIVEALNCGAYLWDKNMLGVYHEAAQFLAAQCMKKKIRSIIIDNTNIKHKDFAKYVEMANLYGYKVEEIIVGDFDEESVKTYHRRCKHNVPIETIQRMARSFER